MTSTQAVFKIKIDEAAPSTCQSREFIDLEISDVRGKCKSGGARQVLWVQACSPRLRGH